MKSIFSQKIVHHWLQINKLHKYLGRENEDPKARKGKSGNGSATAAEKGQEQVRERDKKDQDRDQEGAKIQ